MGEAEQLRQMKSYLYQLVDQLNMTLKDVERGAVASTSPAAVSKKTDTTKDTESTFNAIKALIIKSADIVNAYYDEINYRLEGVYVAQSAFGDYTEKTDKTVNETSKLTEELYKNVQTIDGAVDGIQRQIIEVNAHINSGLLYYNEDGVPVYGLEVGQRNVIDGVETFNKYARFTSDKLAFYDQNDNEVAYVSDRKLYITHVEVTGTFSHGGFKDTALSDGGIVTKWVGV